MLADGIGHKKCELYKLQSPAEKSFLYFLLLTAEHETDYAQDDTLLDEQHSGSYFACTLHDATT